MPCFEELAGFLESGLLFFGFGFFTFLLITFDEVAVLALGFIALYKSPFFFFFLSPWTFFCGTDFLGVDYLFSTFPLFFAGFAFTAAVTV